MGGVHGVDYAKLLGPETSDPSKDQCRDIMQNGWLQLVIGGMVVVTEVLVQGQECIHRANVKGHGNPNAKSAEKIDQNPFVHGSPCEEFDRWIDTWRVTVRHQRNTVRPVHGSELGVIRQSGCFAG
uniref:Uncharacterized protein n=1 Tax=Romanomermis culicivorax TaxID=13658 RepID=A0A915JMI2_ROMCU